MEFLIFLVCGIVFSVPFGMSLAWIIMSDSSQSMEEQVKGLHYQREEKKFKLYDTKISEE